MDSIQFRIDWDFLAEPLATLIVLAFSVERALLIAVESKAFVHSKLDDTGAKELPAFLLSLFIGTTKGH